MTCASSSSLPFIAGVVCVFVWAKSLFGPKI